MSDAWQVFLAGLDPVRLERERFPSVDVVRRESFYLGEHDRLMAAHEAEKRDRVERRRERDRAVFEDVEREIARQRKIAELAYLERRLRVLRLGVAA